MSPVVGTRGRVLNAGLAMSRDEMYLPTECKILSFHGGDYEEWRLLGCYRRVALVRTDVSDELRSLRRLLVTASGL
jgi:hypothetical protein